MTAKTAKERKQDLYEKRKAKGLVRKEVWTRPDLWEQIKRYIDTIHGREGGER